MKNFKVLAVLFFALLGSGISSDIHTKTITGSSATVALASVSTPIKWVIVTIPASGNTGPDQFGDCSITSTTGIAIPAAPGVAAPPIQQGGYDLSQLCVNGYTSDKIYVMWGTN